MKKILPLVFTILILTGTSGAQYSAFAAPSDPPGQIHAPDRLIVKFNPGVSEEKKSSILSSQSANVIDDLPLLKMKIISVPEPALDAVKNALSNNNSVEYAEYDFAVPPTAIPNDPSYGSQWHLPKINAPGAYDITQGDGFPIVILDSGIDMDHFDLSAQIMYPYNGLTLVAGPVDHVNGCGHGTPVAGSAAAETNNGNGIAGVGWNTKIIPVKITNDNAPIDGTECYGWSNGVLRGTEWAVNHGAKVVNLSYGFDASSGQIRDAAQLLRDNNGWLVISAGNSGNDPGKTDDSRIIFVASTTSSDARSSFSSFGNYVDIAAPGSNIVTTSDGNGYGGWYGTSFSAPITASALNLIYSVDPTLTSIEAFDILKDSAVDLGDPGWDTQFGHGRIDAHAAVLAASNSGSPLPEVPPVNFKVAFIGDQGLGTNSEAVLQMIANEGTEMILHQGDLDYTQNPDAWEAQIDLYFGPSFPYFASVGNHDIEVAGQWSGYQAKLQQRLDNIPDATCVGDLGVKASCHYKGLFFILSGVGTSTNYTTTEYVNHLSTELANDDSIWSICSWHKNQQAMQIGGKGNEVGWPAYEACKDGGAIIATAHEHSYERTKTLTNTQTQTVDPTWSESNDVRVAEGSTFAFVSGLGGKSIRDQSRCDPSDVPYGCNNEWANIYALEQNANHGALFCEFNADGQEDRAYCYFKNISGNIIDSFYVTSFMGTANTTSPPNNAPIANSQAESTDENIPLVILLDSTDSNGDSLAFSIESTPANGGLSGTGPYLIYTPNPNFDGIDSFTFKTNDGIIDSNIATVTITVSGDPPGTVNSRINSSTDDAEQRISDNAIDLASTDIEIGNDPGHNLDQIEGLRFNNLDVPQGATITSAFIEFTADEIDSEATSVTIWAQDSDNAGTFTSTLSDISNRPTTVSSVAWNNIPAWNTVGEKHTTPDISVLVQDIVDRSGWNSGNSMAFVISGSGSRTAESWNGDSANAALLHVEYNITPPNNPPTANAGADQNVDEETPVNLSGSGADTDGTIAAYAWTQTAGTTVTLNGANTNTPSFTAPSVGPSGETLTFSLIVTDDDNADSTADTVDINVADVVVPITTIHVGDLDISNTGKKNWHARVLVTVHDEADSAVSNISVSGDWSGDETGSSNCLTNEFGQCEVSQSTRGNMLTFTVTGLAGSNHEYESASNHDSDGDSDGNVITIFKDGTVPGVNVAPQFTSDPIDGQSVSDGQQYSGTISDDATDSNGDPLTFSKQSGPSWLNVSSDGTLSGTATMVTSLPEIQNFIVQVSDPFGLTDTATLQIQITEPAPQEDIHIGLMDGTSTPGKGPRWTATMDISVHDSGESPLSGVTVSGDWSGDANGSASCVTDGSGMCSVSKTIKGGSQATFRVDNLTGQNVNYVFADNDVANQFSVNKP